MAITADRRAISVDRIQFAVVAMREGGHVIKEDACVQGRFRFEITENDQRFAAVAAASKQFPEGISQTTSQRMVSVSQHQDDVRLVASDGMLPADGVKAEDGIVEELDAWESLGRGVAES